MDYMVTAEDIKRMIPGVKIVKFPELVNYSNMSQVLPKKNDCAILFIIDDQTPTSSIGHWTSIMRNGDKYEFFDSYGLSPSGDLEHIPMADRLKFGEVKDYLTSLTGGKLKHNPVRYQSWNPKVATCGRFAITRLIAFINGIKDPKEFYKFMKDAKDKYGAKSFDELAVILTSN